ncbi:MAG TPA: alpha/beta hydrolase [Anaerolineales bacterium]|nr:alpha/beta hydrolase [Anaerolineales bacterium]
MIIHDHDLYVEQHGAADGPPVVLLHHGLGSVSSWQRQIDPLVQAGYRVIAYDRWGFGRSPARGDSPAPHFRQDRLDLLALLDDLGLERAAFIGHSDGGTLALLLALDAPERVACLAVVAAHIYIEPQMLAGIQETYAAFGARGPFYRRLAQLHGEKVELLVNAWQAAWRSESFRNWDLRPRLAAIGCPAYVVQGREDEYATPQHAYDLFSALPNAGLWLAPGAGHMLPQNQPRVFAQFMLCFLNSCWSA